MSDQNNDSFELFEGVTFSTLMSDIYYNSKSKHADIKTLVDNLSNQITIENAEMLVPLVKEYLEIDVKNDEMLVKLASIVQRHLNKGVSSLGELDTLLSTQEKEQLLSAMEEAKQVIDQSIEKEDLE